MNILFYRYNSICEPDLIEAFEEIGLSVDCITEEMTRKDVSLQECIALLDATLQKKAYNFIFSINFYPAISEVCNIYHLPYLCWIVDSPIMELYTTSIRNPWNRIFLFDRTLYEEFAPLNPNCIFHLPLATNVKSKQQVIAQCTHTDRTKFQSDVSFIGSLYTEKNPYDRLKNAPEYLTGFLSALMEAQKKVYGYYFVQECLNDEIVSTFRKHMPDFYTLPEGSYLTDAATVAQKYIGYKITAMERQEMLEALSAHFSVDLYTGSNTASLPKVHNCGFAKTLTEMPVIFHESKINLNMTCKSIRSGIPLRIWDILGCEGFVISNYQAEIPEHFVPGEDIALYSSKEELLTLTDYYLHHENERKEIAHNAYQKMTEYHTFTVRVLQMLQLAFPM